MEVKIDREAIDYLVYGDPEGLIGDRLNEAAADIVEEIVNLVELSPPGGGEPYHTRFRWVKSRDKAIPLGNRPMTPHKASDPGAPPREWAEQAEALGQVSLLEGLVIRPASQERRGEGAGGGQFMGKVAYVESTAPQTLELEFGAPRAELEPRPFMRPALDIVGAKASIEGEE